MIKKNFLSLIAKLKNNIRKKNIDDTKNPKNNKNDNQLNKNKFKNNKSNTKNKNNANSTKNKRDVNIDSSKKRKRKNEKNHFDLICYICDKIDHISFNCSKKNDNKRFKINVAKTKKKIDFRKNRFVRRKQTKNKNRKIIKMNDKIAQRNRRWSTFILLNENVEMNLINQNFIVITNLNATFNELSTVNYLNDVKTYCYETYEISFIMKNSWKHDRIFTDIFYAMNKDVLSIDVILKLFDLINENIAMHFKNKSWWYNVKTKTLKLIKFEKLIKKMKKKITIYTVIIISIFVTFNSIKIDAASTSNTYFYEEFSKMFAKYKNFANVFFDEKIKKIFEHRFDDYVIKTNNANIFFDFLYNLSIVKLKTLRDYLNDLLTKYWIQYSMNFVDVSILFTFKKNDILRLCVDYRDLNKITTKNRYSLFFIFQILNVLIENKFFIKFDFRNAYHRIKIRKKDEWKTIFRTRYDHFEYLMMSFNLINVSATFQIYVNKILIKLMNVIYVIYLDDILMFSKNRETYIKNVRKILLRLRKIKLYAKLKKCFFFTSIVEYFNFIVNENDVSMNFHRVITIMKWSISKFFKNIQIFLKFVNFYRRFIYVYSRITFSLIDMLKKMKIKIKKNLFVWNEKTKKTFNRFKIVFQSTFILIYFDSTFRTKLKTDASNYVLIDIISQLQLANDQWHFVAFYSKKMISTKRNYEIHDQKLLIIIMCFKHWKYYLKNNNELIEILINHNNLKNFMNVQILNDRQIRWIMRLIFFDFVIKHRFEKTNFVDALFKRSNYYDDLNINMQRLLSILQKKLQMIESFRINQTSKIRAICVAIAFSCSRITRFENDILKFENKIYKSILLLSERKLNDDSKQCMFRCIITVIITNEIAYENESLFVLNLIIQLQFKDEFAKKQRQNIKTLFKRRKKRFIESIWIINKKQIFRHQNRIYVFFETAIKIELLKFHHDDEFAEHFDTKKTTELLFCKYFWSDMITYVKTYVKICDVCQRIKTFRYRLYNVLQSLFQSVDSWKKITMNFITEFSFSKLKKLIYDAYLIVIDRYIKMILYISIIKRINAMKLINVIFEKIVLIYDAFDNIMSNREFVFINAYWSNICFHLKIKRRLNIAFHSQTNEQIEWQNQTLKHYLKMYCCDKQKNWIFLLSLIQFAYQNSSHSALNCNSFYVMYEYNLTLRYNVKNNVVRKKMLIAQKRMQQLNSVRKTLIMRWQNVNDATIKHYNKKHSIMKYRKKNLILLFTKNLKLKKFNKKFTNKFINFFRVLKFVNIQIYRFALSEIFKIHFMFYVSYLKFYKRKSNDDVTSKFFLSDLIDNQLKWKIKEILDKKKQKISIITKFDKLIIRTNTFNKYRKIEWKIRKNWNKTTMSKRKHKNKKKLKKKKNFIEFRKTKYHKIS